MIVLKNTRNVRLIDGDARFDLKPGETVSFPAVPNDLLLLVKKGILKEVKAKEKKSVSNMPTEDKAETGISQKEKNGNPSKQAQGK